MTVRLQVRLTGLTDVDAEFRGRLAAAYRVGA